MTRIIKLTVVMTTMMTKISYNKGNNGNINNNNGWVQFLLSKRQTGLNRRENFPSAPCLAQKSQV